MNLVVAVFGLAVYIICHSNSVLGFLPSSESGGRRSDFTHLSITEDGIYKAVAEVIIEKVKPGIYDTDSHTDKVKEYFNSGNEYLLAPCPCALIDCFPCVFNFFDHTLLLQMPGEGYNLNRP